jgi:hypothetical protein
VGADMLSILGDRGHGERSDTPNKKSDIFPLTKETVGDEGDTNLTNINPTL